MTSHVVDRIGLDAMLTALHEKGYRVIGPTVRDDAIVYDDIAATADLPVGWTDQQGGGTYRLTERDDDALFGYNVGPTSWKRFLFPPTVDLLQIERRDGSLSFTPAGQEPTKLAFIGVRACELAAIAIQDKVFLYPGHEDRTYAGRRSGVFIVAVNCGTAGETCFCSSMGTGPACDSGYDVVLTEILTGGSPEYVIEAGSPAGESLLDDLPGREASTRDQENVLAAIAQAEAEMGLFMDTEGIRDLLVENPEHPRWDDVAARCLTCGNCTLACPTCFCSTTVDTVSLDGVGTRSRIWDSCFGLDFTGLHGHPVRSSIRSRYRQWMTHKLATWHDQFGTSGCVGCGRCITWCPVGINITEEVAAIRGTLGNES